MEAAGCGRRLSPSLTRSLALLPGAPGLWPFSGTGAGKGPDKASGQVICRPERLRGECCHLGAQGALGHAGHDLCQHQGRAEAGPLAQRAGEGPEAAVRERSRWRRHGQAARRADGQPLLVLLDAALISRKQQGGREGEGRLLRSKTQHFSGPRLPTSTRVDSLRHPNALRQRALRLTHATLGPLEVPPDRFICRADET